MNQEQIELAQKAMALPGWLFSPPESHKMEPRRSQRGLLWVRSSHPRGPWVPSLVDDSGATDGILFKLLGHGWLVAVVTNQVRLCRSIDALPRLDGTFKGSTLAEACCRAALALGRWPGGAA